MQLVFDSNYQGEQNFVLNKEESSHVVRVMRMKEGEKLFLSNGSGYFFEAEILEAHPSHCVLNVLSKQEGEDKRDFNIHLAIAPTKNIDRIEWLVEKATEIGVDEITFLLCEHSERKVVNTQRLEKIVISAMKQSLKSFKPIINPIIDFKNFVAKVKADYKLLAHCSGEDRRLIKDICSPKASYLILIGPEGDFSEKEILLAKEKDFAFISLGTQRLRTETAGLYSLSSLHYINQ
ncbi:MAG: 16S rRNA (uracil(1498)-N(3))-methyltransferase [Bacteroidota bacterium]|nr:16S rRNA (uracil(1498)-N(3))-methyltransferase [Bacteroidota bacterium]